MTSLLPCVNEEWQRLNFRLQKKVSEGTDSTDEAIVYWYLACYVDNRWKAEFNVVEEDTSTTGGSGSGGQESRKTSKRKGEKHFSNTHREVFEEYDDKICNARELEEQQDCGETWDGAVHKAVVEMQKSRENAREKAKERDAEGAELSPPTGNVNKRRKKIKPIKPLGPVGLMEEI